MYSLKIGASSAPLKDGSWVSMVAHAYNPSTSEAETGVLLEIQGLAWATV